MEAEILCPKCKAPGRVKLGKNLLGKMVHILKCKECNSLSICQDGIHWRIVVESNTTKD